MKTESFVDENGTPYFCVVDGRGHKMRVVGSISEGEGWIAGIRDLMDSGDIMGMGERLVSEADIIEEPVDDIEAIIIYHAYMCTLHRYRVIEALETRKMEQEQER